MKLIKLTQNKEAIIDDEDFEIVNKHKWFFSGRYAMKTFYADKKKKTVLLHRFILGINNLLVDGLETDHINRNKLDNRKSNLRQVNSTINMLNRGISKNNTSGYRGVYRQVENKKWVAHIQVKNKSIYLGTTNDKREAAKLYNEAAFNLYGNFAQLNQI